MERECDNCGEIYNAKPADIKRGWGLTCSKKCAAEKREKSKPDYDKNKVRKNNIKRELWHSKVRKAYESMENKIRQKYPKWTDDQVWEEMYKKTNDDVFLSKEAKDLFIF
jgi:hypothetical protein